MSKPVFTQRLAMHLSGGSKFSKFDYDVFRDGQPTGIKHIRHTNGSPEYLITADVLVAKSGEIFDLKATKGDGYQEWLEAHSEEQAVKP